MRRGFILISAGGGLIVLGMILAILTTFGLATQLEPLNTSGGHGVQFVSKSLEIGTNDEAQVGWSVNDSSQPFYLSIDSATPIQASVFDPDQKQLASFDLGQIYDEYKISPSVTGTYSLVLKNDESQPANARVMIGSASLSSSMFGIAGGVLSVLAGFGTIIAGGIFLVRDRKKQKSRYQVHQPDTGRPGGVSIIAGLTILTGLITMGIGISNLLAPAEAVPQTEGQQGPPIANDLVSGIWETGDGVVALIIGGATLRGKGWAWKSNVVSSFNSLVLPLIMLGIAALYASSVDRPFVGNFATSMLVLSSIISGILYTIILKYLFTSRVKSYFGKGNFSLRRLMRLDRYQVNHYFRHAWISAIITAAVFLLVGLQFLASDLIDAVIWLVLSGVVLALAFFMQRKTSRGSGIALFIIFVIGTSFLMLTSYEHLGHDGFWFLSVEVLGIPLFQGVRSIPAIRSTSIV